MKSTPEHSIVVACSDYSRDALLYIFSFSVVINNCSFYYCAIDLGLRLIYVFIFSHCIFYRRQKRYFIGKTFEFRGSYRKILYIYIRNSETSLNPSESCDLPHNSTFEQNSLKLVKCPRVWFFFYLINEI